MRSWTDLKLVFCAVCVAGSVSCSDDDPAGGTANPPGNGGTAGAAGSAGAAGGGNAGQGGAAGGGVTAGSGGSAGAAAGAGGAAGSAGAAGAAGAAATPDAGVGEPDAGGGDPDAGGDPEPDDVTFGQAFTVLVARCGGCHGANAPGARPRFAIAGDEAASFAATELMSQGALVSDRIIIRAVDQGTMPPACDGGDPGEAGCITVAEADLLNAWVDQGAQE